MRVDRDRFLFLVAAIATPACGRPPTQVAVAVDIVAPPDAGQRAEPQALEVLPKPPDEPTNECDNDVGDVDCSSIASLQLIGPACEGVNGACDGLKEGSGYRRRAASAIAACWSRLGRRVCDINARRKCNLEGARTACAEPRFEAPCQAALDNCKAAGSRAMFTKDECVRVMSAMPDRDRQWALSATGPSREGCRLMYTVY